MVKTISYDTLALEGTNIWVDLAVGELRLEANYSLSSSGGEAMTVRRSGEVQDLLSQADRDAILDITGRLKQALEDQELA